MSDLISLGCPSCGAPIGMLDPFETLRCSYCGAQHTLRQTVTGADRMAAEIAVARLRQEIGELEAEHKQRSAAMAARQAKRSDWPLAIQIALLMVAAAAFAGGKELMLIAFAIFIVIVFLRYRVNAQHAQSIRAATQEQIGGVAQVLTDKRNALLHNQQIANS